MEVVKPTHVTRMLTDEYDLCYDQSDMFTCAQEGTNWTVYWACGRNRTLQMGDVVFFLDAPYHWWSDLEEDLTENSPERGFFARGQLVAGEAKEQLRLLDGETYGDLSATYCLNPWVVGDLSEQEEDLLFVCFTLDSIVDLEHVLPISWLQQQPDCQDLFQDAPYSGDVIPAHLVASLNEYWDLHVRRLEAEDLGLRLSQR